MYSETTVLVTGHAKPVKDDAINTVYQVLAVSLTIETKTDCITGISCTTVMEATQDFLRHLLHGRNIITEMDEMIRLLRTRFFTLAQKPMIVALKDAQNRYLTAFPEKQPR